MRTAVRNAQADDLNEVEAKIVRHLKRTAKLLGAYDIQTALAIRYPNTVYRALDRLAELGLVHRVKSQNAFVVCHDTGNTHAPGFMICNDCGSVQEFDLHEVKPLLRAKAAAGKFTMDNAAIELTGQCFRCGAKHRAKRQV